MNRAWILLTCLPLVACEFLPGGGGGTGGGSGGGGGSFAKGFVFVRKADKNIYVSDDRDFMSSTKLTTEGGAKNPSLSKDARRVVFIRTVGTDTEIAVISTQGGMVSRVLSASAQTNVKNLRNPVFTPDGTQIVFGYDEGTRPSLGVVNADGSQFKKVIGGSTLAYGSPSVFPDGQSVLAGSGNDLAQLTQLEKISLVDGSSMNVTNTLGSATTGIMSRVVVSPDGTKAAFDARVGSDGARIFVIDLTSKAVNQVTDYPGEPQANDEFPCWLGKDKVCFSSDTGGSEQVYALPANGMMTSGGLQLAGATEPWFGPN